MIVQLNALKYQSKLTLSFFIILCKQERIILYLHYFNFFDYYLQFNWTWFWDPVVVFMLHWTTIRLFRIIPEAKLLFKTIETYIIKHNTSTYSLQVLQCFESHHRFVLFLMCYLCLIMLFYYFSFVALFFKYILFWLQLYVSVAAGGGWGKTEWILT